ncbi:MAG: hypothetical protein EON59_01295 [Alphaproteobacteria bacterium]|nr:MAG: hypothetical protein EON59_01295 [Alphaproteobacteria bacterium]
MAAPQTIDAAVCERLINSAVQSCQSVPVAPVAQAVAAKPEPAWDALANSFASLSAAFAWGSIILAIIALAAAIGWGYVVKVWAEQEARKEAAECVKRQMDKWLAEEAPQLIRRSVELLQNTSLGTDDDAAAADEMGKEAG